MSEESKPYLPYQERVIEERDALGVKLKALSAFTKTIVFAGLDPAEQARLREQRTYMSAYYDVLDERIAAFRA
jgi:hypothetical protein